LPRAGNPAPIERVFASGEPQVTGLFFSKVAQRWIVALDVPVKRNGRVVYCLDMAFEPKVLSELLAAQSQPPMRYARLSDENNLVIARSSEAERYLGQAVPAWFVEASAEQTSGVLVGPSLLDEDAVGAFDRLRTAPWTIVVSESLAVYESAWRRPYLVLGGGALVAIGLSAALVWLFSRRVTAPIDRLAASAADLLEGRTGTVAPIAIPELEKLRQALARAAGAMREAAVEHSRRAAAESAAAIARASEERFRLMARATSELIWEWNVAENRVFWGENYAAVVGHPPELIHPTPGASAVEAWNNWDAFIHPEDRARCRASFTEAIEQRREFWTEEFRFQRPDGYAWFVERACFVYDDDGRLTRVVGSVIDISERKRAEEQQRLLAREIDHRAKNLLSIVQSIIRLSRAETTKEFVARVEGRVAAMRRAHDLLSAAHWEGLDLRQLVDKELAPYRQRPIPIEASGPPVHLSATAGQSMALVLHELATNAVKYGALSAPQGRVRVTWEVRAEGLSLEWVEAGGPTVVPPSRRGFGTDVIRAGVESQLGGRVAFDWRPEGLRLAMTIPASQLAPRPARVAETERRIAVDDSSPVAAPPLVGKRILIVEDEALVAMEMAAILAQAGYVVAGPVARLDEALARARGDAIDGALLDLNLGGLSGIAVAELLAEQGVPFAFVTGYEDTGVPPSLGDVPVVGKPFSAEELTRTVGAMLSWSSGDPA
jgi:PAS domain S-box-containing protein